MDKDDRHEPPALDENSPADSGEPASLSASLLERRRRRFSIRSDGIGTWKSLQGVQLPDSPFLPEFVREEEEHATHAEAGEITGEDFLV